MIDAEDFMVFADTIPHTVWMVTVDGRLEYVNRCGTEYCGQTADDIGTSWIDLVHPDDAPAVMAAWTHMINDWRPPKVECRLRRQDGEYRWHRLQALALRDRRGELHHWMGVGTDVDDEHRGHDQIQTLERSTSETEVLLETLQFNAPVGFGFLDLDLRIVRENELLAVLRGGEVADQVGLPLKDVIPGRWPSVEPILDEVLTTGTAALNHEFAITLPAEPNRIRHLSGSYYPVRVAGELIGVGVVAIDITERKEAEIARRQLTLAAVAAIAAATGAHDPYTAGHQRRVAVIAAAIATEIGLDSDEVDAVRTAAGIHDIGKLAVPSEILSYPRRLSAPEFEIVKTHCQVGHDIVAGLNLDAPIVAMICQHHERLNGTGYPNGLKGDEILLGARVIAVADVVEAMASHRPYRPALDLEVALDEIRGGSGNLYEPNAVDACERLFRENRLNIDLLD